MEPFDSERISIVKALSNHKSVSTYPAESKIVFYSRSISRFSKGTMPESEATNEVVVCVTERTWKPSWSNGKENVEYHRHTNHLSKYAILSSYGCPKNIQKTSLLLQVSLCIVKRSHLRRKQVEYE